MSRLDVHIQKADTTDDAADYLALVEATDGRKFRLGILSPVIEVWKQQVEDLNIDEMAAKLAIDLLNQDPSSNELDEGFLVTLDNGFATPIAAEQNIKNSGVLPFLARKYKGESTPTPDHNTPGR